MTIRYDKKADTLSITLGPEAYEGYNYETGDFTVNVDEGDAL